MIIAASYAHRLIEDGRAKLVSIVEDYGKSYGCINRWDMARTDHYLLPYDSTTWTKEEKQSLTHNDE